MAVETPGKERFESPQVHQRAVLLSALGFLLLLGFAILALQAVYYRQVPVQRHPLPEQFPQPRVETGQRRQLLRLQAEQMKRLTTYAWIDRRNGIVQIPIERAMQILAGEGTQAYAPLAPAQALAVPSAGAERLLTRQAGVPPPGGAAPSPGNPPATPEKKP